MTEFVCRLADIIIGVSANFPETKLFCKDYLTSDAPDFTVEVTAEDMEREREFARQTSIAEFGRVMAYSDTYLETLALYRKIAEKMINYRVLIFHGSAIAVDDVGYIFTAKSGTGKSTHTRLWRKQFGDRAYMVNDDKPLIKITDDGVFVCGTPWDGKHHISKNVVVPLNAICILNRGSENTIEPVSPKDAFSYLFQQIYMPRDKDFMLKALEIVKTLSAQINFYRLFCNMEQEAAIISYEGMQ